MLYNIKTGWGGIAKHHDEDIIILVTSLYTLLEKQISFLFTGRHAYLQAARFFSDINRLDQIDWPLLQTRDFRRNPDDPEKLERYQAEALVHRNLPCDGLLGIACYDDAVAAASTRAAADRNLTLRIITRRNWYF